MRGESRNPRQKAVCRRPTRSVSNIPNPEAEPLSPMRPGDLAELPTRELLEAVVHSGYTGHAWEELARRLYTRALPDLERSIRNGSIIGRCQRAGRAIRAHPKLQRPPASEDVAAEAVEQCLARFKDNVLPAGAWDPERGTSLEDFFTSCCLSDLANLWRWHERRLRLDAINFDGLDEPERDGVCAQALDPPLDPAHVIELRDQVTRATAAMSPGDQETFTLISQGWSPAEIARLLGVRRNTLDARISRARKAARARRTP